MIKSNDMIEYKNLLLNYQRLKEVVQIKFIDYLHILYVRFTYKFYTN